MRYVIVGVFFVSGLAPRLSAQIRELQPVVPEVTATGRGDVLVTPDRGRLAIMVESHADNASKAASDNAFAVASVRAALLAAGATQSDIRTVGYNVSQDYDRGKPKGFVARNSMRVEVQQISLLGKLIDAALKGGATQLAPVQFLGPGLEKARHEALAQAIARARGDAEAMAQAAGGVLGDIISLTSSSFGPGSYEQPMQVNVTSGAVSGSMNPTSFNVSDLTVSATAVGKWRYVVRRQ
jgi:uncharacterized protein YggE